ncbi:MAG: peptidoglycan DD-metalloendopeptidase family protein [Thermodesulfobacteriota bacterium]|nr:peptidoglycan DD-metalloendopeptidase family protein [Thermodesulfobacteriota bacterium]
MLYLLATILKRVAPGVLACAIVAVMVTAGHGEAVQTAEIRASLLNMRARPDRAATRLGMLKKGTQVTVLDDTGDWLKISHNDTVGYIRHRSDYVRLNPPPPARQIEELKEKARQIDREIETHKKEIAAYGQQEVELVAGLHDIDRSLNRSHTQIDAISAAVDAAARKIEENRKAARVLEQRIEKNRHQAARRLTALYKLELMGAMNLLGSAESMFSFLKTRRDIERICEYDAAVLEQYLSDKTRLAALTKELHAEKAEKETLESELKRQRVVLDKEKARRQRLLTEIREEGALRQAAIASLKQAAKDLDKTIAALHEEVARAPVKGDGSFPRHKGLLKMPVNGRIISKFGKYKNPELNIVNFRSGIDIAARQGEPIHAVYQGRVLYADWFKGYGNMLILDHGDGFYTVYAHAQELFKKKGEAVATHEVIATVGETASMTGTALYFEVRHRGIPEDPMKWLKTG